jgi:hypothetical protein
MGTVRRSGKSERRRARSFYTYRLGASLKVFFFKLWGELMRSQKSAQAHTARNS